MAAQCQCSLLLVLAVGCFLVRPLHASSSTSNSSSTLYSKYLTVSNTEQAYVSAGSLVSFGSQLLAQEKSDILDSLLYAEQMASKMYDKTAHFNDWYTVYIDTLREVGWEIGPAGFTPYKPDGKFVLLDWVWKIMKPYCKAIQAEVLNRMMEIWKQLKDYDHRVHSFMASSSTGTRETNAANFQIMPAVRGNTEEVLIVFGGFYYQANTAVKRFLIFSWTTESISVHHSIAVSKFKSSAYAKYRSLIQNMLKNRANDLIHQINLPSE